MTTLTKENVPLTGKPFQTLLLAGLTAGTLDALAAILILAKGNAVGVFKYIASAWFGMEAFSGGMDMIFAGILFHYLIAFLFTLFYFAVYPHVSFLKKNLWLSSIVYGVFVWSVMNLCILPLTRLHRAPFDPKNALVNMVILMFSIGLPVAFYTARYYQPKLHTSKF